MKKRFLLIFGGMTLWGMAFWCSCPSIIPSADPSLPADNDRSTPPPPSGEEEEAFCSESNKATSLSIPSELKAGWCARESFLYDSTDHSLYLIGCGGVFHRKEKGTWESLYQVDLSNGSSVNAAVLDETNHLLYLSTGFRGGDILQLDLTNGQAKSVVTDPLKTWSAQGILKELPTFLSFDRKAGILYAASPNQLFSKTGTTEWQILLNNIPSGISAIFSYSKGDVPVVCVQAYDGGDLFCREGQSDFNRISDPNGLSSPMTQTLVAPTTIKFLYDDANDILYKFQYRPATKDIGGFVSESDSQPPVCRFLLRKGDGGWENNVTLQDHCFSDLVYNTTTKTFYLIGDDCSLYSYADDTLVSVTSLPSLASSPLQHFVCASSLLTNSSGSVLYSPLYEDPCPALDGSCPSPREVMALCVEQKG